MKLGRGLAVLVFCSVFFSQAALFAKAKIEEPPPPKKIIAVLPIQKSIGSPLYLSKEPGLFAHLKRMAQEKRIRPSDAVDYDPEYVTKTLGYLIAESVLAHDFLIFPPEKIEPIFDRLVFMEKELPLERLNGFLNADGFLLVTVTDWDAETFDQTGKVRVGFEASLIDAGAKRPVWTNRAVGLELETPSDDFFYSKYQRDILSDLAHRILKGFPEKTWESK